MNPTFNLKSASLMVAIALASACFSTSSFAKSDDLNQSPMISNFKALDTDSDGTLTSTEAGKDQLFNKSNFGAADADNDGTLTLGEYADYKSQAQSTESSRVMNDSVITARVKADILKEEGLKGMRISVETYKGVVQLSGFVESKTQVARVEEIAKATEGVKSVKNSLVVKS